jgi:hypothetical protein
MMKWNESYIEWCEIMHQEPNTRDQIIFEAGAVFRSIDIKQAQDQKQLPPDIALMITISDKCMGGIMSQCRDCDLWNGVSCGKNKQFERLIEYIKTGM